METCLIGISNGREVELVCSCTYRAGVGEGSATVGLFGSKRGRKTGGALSFNLCSMKVSCVQTVLAINAHPNPKINTTCPPIHQAGTASGLTSDHVIQVLKSYSDPKQALGFFLLGCQTKTIYAHHIFLQYHARNPRKSPHGEGDGAHFRFDAKATL